MDDVAYFDHAACAPLERAALDAMLNVGHSLVGNPDSVHLPGRKARAMLDEARANVASFLGADPTELHFFGSATAALHAAVAAACGERGGLLVSSVLEHPSVIDAVAQRSVGQPIQLVLGRDGAPSLEESMPWFEQASVVALSACNHELGSAPDLSKARAASRDAIWIVDAVQAAPWIDLRPLLDARTLLVASSSKLGGPPGIAALRVPHELRRLPAIARLTQPTPVSWLLAVGFGAALRSRAARRAADLERTRALARELLDGLKALAPDLVHNGGPSWLGPIVNISFPQVSAMSLEHALDLHGVSVSRTAACRQRIEDHSPVVRAAYPAEPWRATTSIRWSLGWSTTSDDIARALSAVQAVLTQLRSEPGQSNTPSPLSSGFLPPVPIDQLALREDD